MNALYTYSLYPYRVDTDNAHQYTITNNPHPYSKNELS